MRVPASGAASGLSRTKSGSSPASVSLSSRQRPVTPAHSPVGTDGTSSLRSMSETLTPLPPGRSAAASARQAGSSPASGTDST